MRTRLGRLWPPVLGAGSLLLLVEVVSRSGLVAADALPPATAILATTARVLLEPELATHVAGTLAASAIGLALATAVGVPLGLLLGRSRRSRLAAAATIELLRPIPSVALIPLVILLLGRGLDMKVVVIAYAASWPILLNAIAGARAADPTALETARAYGLPRVAVLWRIVVPAAAPFAFTGIRIAAAIALVVAVSAELLAGGGLGIGTWLLSVSQAGVPRELLYAGIVITGLLGVTIDAVLVAIERRLFAWHPRVRGAA